MKGPEKETFGHAITLVRRPEVITYFDREGVSPEHDPRCPLCKVSMKDQRTFMKGPEKETRGDHWLL